MFINTATGRPAWLLEQDAHGDVWSTDDAASVETRDIVEICSAYTFFSTHREATADDLARLLAAPAGAISLPMYQPPAPAPVTVTPAGLAPAPKAARPAAKKKPATKTKPAAEKKPATQKRASQEGGAQDPPPAPAPSSVTEPPAPVNGPHGEQGRD